MLCEEAARQWRRELREHTVEHFGRDRWTGRLEDLLPTLFDSRFGIRITHGGPLPVQTRSKDKKGSQPLTGRRQYKSGYDCTVFWG